MNYHFTTTKVHFELVGGKVLELYIEEALKTKSTHPFKGNMDLEKLRGVFEEYGRERIPFVRMEATTNLIGGQPFSMENLRGVKALCEEHGIPLVLDGSMLDWNAYLIKQREEGYGDRSLSEIVREMCDLADIFYASTRKVTSVRGGFIATRKKEFFDRMRVLLPVYEGFFTYGGMSMREIGAMAVGLREMVEEALVGSEVELVRLLVEELDRRGIPVVTPPGGLGAHIDASEFLPHVSQHQYPAGSLAAALYLVSGIRAMERGTMSMERDEEGREIPSELELVRVAFPRKVYLRSHVEYAVDRITWLYEHRDLIKGLRWIYEPPVLRFFLGRLEDIDDWGKDLCEAYRKELGNR
jgi:tryptophanase